MLISTGSSCRIGGVGVIVALMRVGWVLEGAAPKGAFETNETEQQVGVGSCIPRSI